MKRSSRRLRDGKRYGASSVLLVPAVVNKEVSYDDAYKRSQAEIRKAIPLAEELGVKIAIENVWNHFLLSPLEAARYVDEFNSPAVGWHFDVGNILNYGWPEQWIRILGPRIQKLHIKEFSRKKRDSQGLWKGFDVKLLEGDNNWPAVMKAAGRHRLSRLGDHRTGRRRHPGGPQGPRRPLDQDTCLLSRVREPCIERRHSKLRLAPPGRSHVQVTLPSVWLLFSFRVWV